MALLVEAGLSPSEVLYEATNGAAHLWLSSPSFGTIEPGKSADLVLLDGDLFADINAAAHVDIVIRAGRVVDPIPRERPAAAHLVVVSALVDSAVAAHVR